MDSAWLQVSTARFPGTVFVTLFPTAVERASCGEHKLLGTGEVSTILTSIVLVVADGLSCLYVLERLGQAIHWRKLFIGTSYSLGRDIHMDKLFIGTSYS